MSPVDITVDCPSCAGSLKFGDDTCARCGKPVPDELRTALETRLEAASSEFRELKSSTRNAAIVLPVLGLGHVFVGLLLFWVATSSDLAGGAEEKAIAMAMLVSNLTIGVLFLGCYKWAGRQPVRALVAAVLVLIGTRALATAASPLSIVTGLWVNLAVLIVLAHGLWSARKASRLAKKFREAQNVS